MRMRCPEHGLLLRGNKGRFCPACGKRLISFSIWPIWKVYISTRAALFVMVPVMFFGIVFAFDAPGGMSGCAARSRVAAQEQEAQDRIERQERKTQIDELPEQWRGLYTAMSLMSSGPSWSAFTGFLDVPEEDKLPHLTPEQLSLFLETMNSSSRREVAFAMINKKMRSSGS